MAKDSSGKIEVLRDKGVLPKQKRAKK